MNRLHAAHIQPFFTFFAGGSSPPADPKKTPCQISCEQISCERRQHLTRDHGQLS